MHIWARKTLLSHIRSRYARQLAAQSGSQIDASDIFKEDVLTVGFARRFAKGCSLERSRLATSLRSSSSLKPGSGMRELSVGLPSVSVPVIDDHGVYLAEPLQSFRVAD